jgi:hypothetical protein
LGTKQREPTFASFFFTSFFFASLFFVSVLAEFVGCAG